MIKAQVTITLDVDELGNGDLDDHIRTTFEPPQMAAEADLLRIAKHLRGVADWLSSIPHPDMTNVLVFPSKRED